VFLKDISNAYYNSKIRLFPPWRRYVNLIQLTPERKLRLRRSEFVRKTVLPVLSAYDRNARLSTVTSRDGNDETIGWRRAQTSTRRRPTAHQLRFWRTLHNRVYNITLSRLAFSWVESDRDELRFCQLDYLGKILNVQNCLKMFASVELHGTSWVALGRYLDHSARFHPTQPVHLSLVESSRVGSDRIESKRTLWLYL